VIRPRFGLQCLPLFCAFFAFFAFFFDTVNKSVSIELDALYRVSCSKRRPMNFEISTR
jgi:hypothetical protein